MEEALLKIREVSKHFGVRLFVFIWPLVKGAV